MFTYQVVNNIIIFTFFQILNIKKKKILNNYKFF